MTKSVTVGPNGTAVAGVTAVAVTVAPLNYDADFLPLVDDPGVNIYVDSTAPVDQPATVRLATRDVANIYAGTSIDPAVFLASRKGRDIVVQVQEIHKVTDSEDADYLRMYPIKATLTINAPVDAIVTSATLERMVARVLASIARQGEDDLASGLTALHRGVTSK